MSSFYSTNSNVQISIWEIIVCLLQQQQKYRIFYPIWSRFFYEFPYMEGMTEREWFLLLINHQVKIPNCVTYFKGITEEEKGFSLIFDRFMTSNLFNFKGMTRREMRHPERVKETRRLQEVMFLYFDICIIKDQGSTWWNDLICQENLCKINTRK